MSSAQRRRFEESEFKQSVRVIVLARSGGQCEYTEAAERCQKQITWRTMELAHRVACTKRRLKDYGYRVMWSPAIVMATCHEHNAAALIGNKGLVAEEIIQRAMLEANR